MGIRKFVIITLVVLLIAIVAGGLYWKFYLNRTLDAAEVLSADTELLLHLDWREDGVQNINLNSLSENFGGRTTVDGILVRFLGKTFANSDFNFRNDIAPWLGNDLVVSRRTLGDAATQIYLFTVNDEKARDIFLNRLEKEATNVSTEVYKNHEIKTLTGKVPVSVTMLSKYLVVGAKPKLVKDAIDISDGTTPSLYKTPNFAKISRNTDHASLLYGLLDIAPLVRNSSLLGAAAPKSGDHARLGLSLGALDSGFSMKVFVPGSENNKTQKSSFNANILNLLPNSIVGYLGGTDVSGFVREYLTTLLGIPNIFQDNLTTATIEKKYNVNLENDLYSWMTGEYGVAYMDEKRNDFALILAVNDPADVQKKMRNVEKAIAGLISDKATDPLYKNISFSESTSGGTVIRYLPLPGNKSQYLNYAFKDTYLILTTSRDALDSILVPSTTQPSFLKSRVFSVVSAQVPKENTSGAFFMNNSFLLQFISSLGYNLMQYKPHFAGLDFTATEIKDGTLVTGFLPIL